MNSRLARRNWRAALSLLSITVLLILGVGLSHSRAARRMESINVVMRPDPKDQNAIDYHVWQVAKEKDQKGFITVIVSVNPRHFNRRDMTSLAVRLNKEFAKELKLKVGLLDDENAARLFVAGRLEYSGFEEAERGRYYLDRAKCKEYIQFSTERRRPRQTINFKCSGL